MLSSCETGGTGIRREKMEDGEALVFPPSAAIAWLLDRAFILKHLIAISR